MARICAASAASGKAAPLEGIVALVVGLGSPRKIPSPFATLLRGSSDQPSVRRGIVDTRIVPSNGLKGPRAAPS